MVRFRLRTLICCSLLFAIALSLLNTNTTFANPAADDVPADLSPTPALSDRVSRMTPLQQAVLASLEEQQLTSLIESGKVTFEIQTHNVVSAASGDLESSTITGTIVMAFAGPHEAGLDVWPPLVIPGTLPEGAEGFALPGDYSEEAASAIAAALPGIWEQYTFGEEPRKVTITETIVVTYPPSAVRSAALPSISAVRNTPLDEIVVGFLTAGPRIDYTIGEEWEECILSLCTTLAEFKAGFALDYDFGLRLPFLVEQNGIQTLTPGANQVILGAKGLDWSAKQYKDAGFTEYDGGEFIFLFDFFLGAQAKIGGIKVVGWALEPSFSHIQSLLTTVVPGEALPLDKVRLSPQELGTGWGIPGVFSYGGGLELDPQITLQEIAADFCVTGAASGAGKLTFDRDEDSEASANITLEAGPQADAQSCAVVGSGNTGMTEASDDMAEVVLDKFEYKFSKFEVQTEIQLTAELLGWGGQTGYKAFNVTPPSGNKLEPFYDDKYHTAQASYPVDLLYYTYLPSIRTSRATVQSSTAP